MRLSDRIREASEGLPRPFWVLCAGMLVNRAGSFVVPFLSVYLTRERGHSMATAGLVAAVYGAGAMLASITGGYLADRIGRRPTMLMALGIGGLGMVALGFVRDIRLIVPACFVIALTGEAYRPAMQAAVSDLVPPRDRVRAFGILYWVINIGFSIGALLGGALASASFLLLFLFDGLTSVLFALLVARSVRETRPAPPPRVPGHRAAHPVREFFAPYFDGPFGAFVLLSILVLLVFMQHVAALPIAMTDHGVSRAWLGAVLAINGIVIVVLQPLLASFVQSRNRSHMLATGSLLVGLGFGLNALARGPGLFGLGVVIWTLGEILVLPIANAVVADVAPADRRGRYQGAYGLSFGLAGFGAPLIGTAVMQRLGSPALWAGCLVLGLLVAVGHLLLAPRLTRMREERLAAREAAH